jgi:hypothetical protein
MRRNTIWVGAPGPNQTKGTKVVERDPAAARDPQPAGLICVQAQAVTPDIGDERMGGTARIVRDPRA